MTYMVVLLLSIFLSYIVITPHVFPYVGLSLFFISFASLVLYIKKEKKRDDVIFFIICLLFAAFITIRANPFLTFLNTIATIYTGMLLIIPKQKQTYSLIQLAFLPFTELLSIFKTENKLVTNLEIFKNQKATHNTKIIEYITSTIVTLLILIIILPLLSYANPIFKNWVESVFTFINLETLIDFLLGDSAFIQVLRVTFVLILTIVLPRLLTYVSKPADEMKYLQANFTIPLFIPKIITGIVLLIFFISQLQLYLASTEVLEAMNITHSQYAREVFAQLSLVALIILALIYNDKDRSNKLSKALTYILIAEGVFLTLIGLKSVFDYSSNFGFTHKRLWGYTGVIWFLGVFGLFTYFYKVKEELSGFIRYVVIFSAGILLLVNIANFDYLIFHYFQSRTGEGTDLNYLTFNLTPDALAYDELLEMHREVRETTTDRSLETVMMYRIDSLQDKYENLDIRGFNLNEYLQYLQVKDIEVDITGR